MQNPKVIAYLKAIFTVIAWGASFITTKIALRDLTPMAIVWLRFAIGVLILGTTILIRKQLHRINIKDFLYFALLGAIGITYHQWLQSAGLVTAQASTTAWIVASTPIFIAILSWFLLKEKLNPSAIFGILLAAIGVLLVVSKGSLNAVFAGQFSAPGDKLILLSAPNWAIFTILSRHGLKKHPAALMMFYVMLTGWLFTSIQFLASASWQHLLQLTPVGWLGIAFLGVVCSGFAYVFWYDALQTLPASQVSAFLYIEPIIAVIVSAAILGEKITFSSMLGGTVILLGVWLVNRPSSSSSREHS